MVKKAENTVNPESATAAEERTALVVVGIYATSKPAPGEYSNLDCHEFYSETAADVGKKNPRGSIDRDLALAELEKEKKLSFVKAWEQSEISKAVNKAQKKLSTITAWENSQKASKEADLRKTEEQLEKKKAEYGEKIRNEVALIHRQADEKRAVIHAQRGEDILKAEELAVKYGATGSVPKKFLGCF